MPTTRRKILLVTPFGLLIGVIAVLSQVNKHGFSTAVLCGLLGGGFLGAALCIAVAINSSAGVARRTPADRRREQQRVQSMYVPLGLAGAGLISFVGAIAGNGVQGIGTFLIVAASLLFAIMVLAVGTLAVVRPQLWD